LAPSFEASDPREGSLATHSNHSRSIGNCCPTSCTRSHIYHYITYPCPRADNFAAADDKRRPKSAPPPRPGRGKRQDGPYTRRRNPRTGLKIGHYIGKPRRRETQAPPSQNEDGAPGHY